MPLVTPIGVAVSGCLALAVLGTAAAQTVPQDSGLEEEARVRVRTVRIRFEPTSSAEPGECLELGLDDLAVSIRGKRLERDDLLELERETQPTLHALLLDTSASMYGKIDLVREAAAAYVEQLEPEYEKALVVGFDESVILYESATSNRARTIEGIERVRLSNSTSMFDGLYYTIEELNAHRERPVILLLTDGMDTSSLHDYDDVKQVLARLPELTIFTVGVSLPDIGPRGNLTKKILERLAYRSDGMFFDIPTALQVDTAFRRIREILDNEATLVVYDPDPLADLGKIKVRAPGGSCDVRVLGMLRLETVEDPSSRPLPEPAAQLPWTLKLSPGADYRRYYLQSRALAIDPDCRSGATGPGAYDDAWYVTVDEDRLRGCAIDLTMDYGQLYSVDAPGWVASNGWVGLKTRAFDIPFGSLDELPSAPEQLMDRLADYAVSVREDDIEIDTRNVPRHEHARPYHDFTGLFNGRLFFDLRPRLAEALYLRSDYRAWVRDRLQQEADREMEAVEERFRRRFPDVEEALLAEVVRESEEAGQIRMRAETPSERDVRQYLAAWLGDIPAHDLFVRWEKGRINRLLDGRTPDDGPFVEGWHALRRIFFVPSYSRILLLLAPIRDLETDAVGYYRILLPRPGWLGRRTLEFGDSEIWDLPLDLIPDVPLGYHVIERLLDETQGFATSLRESGYRLRSLSYELRSEPWRWNPRCAFDESRVSLEFADRSDRRLTLRADLRLEHSSRSGRPRRFGKYEKKRWGQPEYLLTPKIPVVEHLEIASSDDTEVADLIRPVQDQWNAAAAKRSRKDRKRWSRLLGEVCGPLGR